MRGAGDKIGDADRAGIETRGDQTGVVRHVHEQIRADAVGDRAKALPVDHQRVSGSAGDDHLGLVLVRQFRLYRVVDRFGLRH